MESVDNPPPCDPPCDPPRDLPRDLVADALADARGMARGNRTRRRGAVRRRRPADGSEEARARRTAWSAAGADPDRDPQPLQSIVRSVFAERGWQRPLTEARALTDWPALVGEEISSHCRPIVLHEGELKISAQSSAWATQIRLMAPSILARLATELGAGVVTRLIVSGPTGPSWKHGYRSVPGARGPRDTYG